MMSDLLSALMFGAAGTVFLAWRDRLIAANLEAYRRLPFLHEFRSSVAGRTLLNASIDGSR